MPTEWETDVCIKLNALTQSENQTFHDYSTAVWNKNSLLYGTESFLNDVKLHTHIEVGMDPTLARCVHSHNKELHLIVLYQSWLDTDLQVEHAECHAELEAIMKSMWNKSYYNHTLCDPSHKYNTSSSAKPTLLQMYLPPTT